MTTDIRDRIRPVSEIPHFLKVELYGRSGTGKTTIIGSFPTPSLILDVNDKGTSSLAHHENIEVLEIETWQDFEDIYYYLAASGNNGFKTVGIDTVTQLQDLALKHILGDGPVGNITKRTWGEASSLLKAWLVLYRDLGVHVVFTAQDRITTPDEDADEEDMLDPEIGPYVMPSVAKVLNACVGIAGQTFIREVETGRDGLETEMQYCLRIGPHPRYYTKLRRDPTLVTETLPSVVVNPTFKKLLKLSTKDLRKRRTE